MTWILNLLTAFGLLLILLGALWIGSHWLSTVIPISDFSLADYFGYFGTSVQTSLNMMAIGGLCVTPGALVKLGR